MPVCELMSDAHAFVFLCMLLSFKSFKEEKHLTERWPPGREQLDNFLSNVLPAGEASEYLEEIREWYKEQFKSEFKPRTRNLTARLPFEHAKQGQYAGDKVEFVIVKDHKNRTDNMAAKEIPKGLYNVHLLRYFIEAEWQLPRPDVIISVTGGAQAFDLPSVHKDMIMKGMMENTRDMQPLFITGGTNSGKMLKYARTPAHRNMRVGVGVCAYLEESYWLIERPFVVWWRLGCIYRNHEVRGRGTRQGEAMCILPEAVACIECFPAADRCPLQNRALAPTCPFDVSPLLVSSTTRPHPSSASLLWVP